MKNNFLTTEFFHTYNRGVEKRNTFLDEKDYFRGVHDLYEFNDANATLNLNYHLNYWSRSAIDFGAIDLGEKKKKGVRDLLIDLFAWTFIPNHYHNFLRGRVERGISKFQQKWGGGYTNYFNLKYKRSGVLFQGKYKKISVTNDAQAAHLVCYIHSNSLDIWKPNWKEKGLSPSETQNALKFLEKYRWSSHMDYWGVKNFPSLINTEFLFKFFGGPEGYRKFFIDWLKQYDKNIKFIQKFTLE